MVADSLHGTSAPDLRLKILLIAYEFPPSPSPQSLRWAYLARELVANGHEVHVLAPEHPGAGTGLPTLPPGIVVHRTFAGPVMGLLGLMGRRWGRGDKSVPSAASARPGGAIPDVATQDEGAPASEVLNWKGHAHHAFNRAKVALFNLLQRTMSLCLFPDSRAEWLPWARRRLRQLLPLVRPDVVISSHEPATTLALGLIARRAGFPWIADLGDPVLAPYTPGRWRLKALRLEKEVCAAADLVVTTTEVAASVLRERHPLQGAKLRVLTQGFDEHASTVPGSGRRRGRGTLELLYTGSFYAFRRSSELVDAVVGTPGVTLSIASMNPPREVLNAAMHSQSIKVLGFVPHAEALRLQSGYDVLVNIANDDPGQVPGKFYEYLGSGRPILHVGSERDAAATLLLRIGRGWVCPGQSGRLRDCLAELVSSLRAGTLTQGMDLSEAPVKGYDWKSIGDELSEAAIAVVAMNHHKDQ